MANTPAADAAPEVTGSAEAYERFLPEAEKLDASQVDPHFGDATLALQNVQTAIAALAPLKDRIKDELPKLKWAELEATADLASAVVFATTQTTGDHSDTLQSLMKRAVVSRTLLLSSAETLSVAKLLPAADVAKIRAGSGRIDQAKDCVALAALFRNNAAKIKGKHAVSAADLKEAAEVGDALLKLLKPKGAKSKPATGPSVEHRNRLWSLLVQRFAQLRQAGMYFWIDDVNDHVPPLQSRAVAKKKLKAAPAPAPSP